MNAHDRRTELMRILVSRRHATMRQLANDLGVSVHTVYRDIEFLTSDHPIETIRGNGGGVRLPDWYKPHTTTLTRNQQQALVQLLEKADEFEATAIREILISHGSPDIRKKILSNA